MTEPPYGRLCSVPGVSRAGLAALTGCSLAARCRSQAPGAGAQHTGYWQANREGLDPRSHEERAAALDLLASDEADAFVQAAATLPRETIWRAHGCKRSRQRTTSYDRLGRAPALTLVICRTRASLMRTPP